jgi:hypothetical protein
MRSRGLCSAFFAAMAVVHGAHAQETTATAPAMAPSAPKEEAVGVLAVEVEPGAGGLDAASLRESIAREAAVRVTDAGAQPGPRLAVRGNGEHGLTFRLVGAGQHDTERTIELPDGSDAKRLATAGLVAASLLEDDAAELLARLRAEAKKPEPPSPPSEAELRRRQRLAARLPRPTCGARRPELVRFFGADVAPFVGMSAFEPAGTVRHVSLELLGGGTSGVTGLEFSPLVTFNAGFVCGVQFSGLGSWTSDHVHGAEISGFIGWADKVEGVQGNGFLSVTTHTLRGLQFAPIAMANEIQGVQLGSVTVAGDVHGLQLGVLNVARSSDASVGVLSLVTSGRTTLHGFVNSNGVASVAVQHGSRYVHNFYGGSVSAGGQDGVGFGPLIGIGAHGYEDARFYLDIDLFSHILFGSKGSAKPQSLWEARVVAGWRLSPTFALYAGPLFDALDVPKGESRRALDGVVLKKALGTGDHTTYLSPGLVVGVRGL